MKIDDAGIGAAARMGMAVYDQASRGTGRTHRMVLALEEGATVFHDGNSHWIRDIIRKVRGPDFARSIRIVSCENWAGLERGLNAAARERSPVAIDHHLIHLLYQEAINRTRDRLNSLGIGEPPFATATDQPPPIEPFLRV